MLEGARLEGEGLIWGAFHIMKKRLRWAGHAGEPVLSPFLL